MAFAIQRRTPSDWERLNICALSSNTHLCLGHWTLDSWHTLELAVTRSPIASCHEKNHHSVVERQKIKQRDTSSVSQRAGDAGWGTETYVASFFLSIFKDLAVGHKVGGKIGGNKNKWKSPDLSPSEMVSIIKDGRDGGHALWCGYIRFLFFLCKATGIRAFQHWWLPFRVAL